jgi:uncharacterized OB-fold protein
MSALPVRPPHRNQETEPFWAGCARGVLVLPRCDRCGEHIWYPRRYCPFCSSRQVSWVEVSGRGTIYSFTVMRRGDGPYRAVAPYVLAYVELDEGPRVLTNIVEVDVERVAVGQAVRAVFDPAGDQDAILRFAPLA